jgi:pyridoxine 5-phosphate synthase
VPEKREERTTEGGLDVATARPALKPFVAALKAASIRVSLFIEADPRQIEAAQAVGADIVELHTGRYCEHVLAGQSSVIAAELAKITRGAELAHAAGLEVHAGHGLTYNCVRPIAAIPAIAELNIGHFLVGEAIFMGLPAAVRHMRRLMDEARQPPGDGGGQPH